MLICFFTKALQEAADEALFDIVEYTKGKNIVVIVGMPVSYYSKLYNCAITISNGKIVKIQQKLNLANYNEFYEKRWFSTVDDDLYIEKYDCQMNSKSIIDLGDDIFVGI